jgi:hypothetical protein
MVKSAVTGYRTYEDDSGAFSIDTPLEWRMRRIMFPAIEDFPALRVIYLTPEDVADEVLPKVTEPDGLYGVPEPVVVVAAADEETEGINDIPLADALGARNATVVSERKRTYGTVEAKESQLRWSDPSGPKHATTIILTRPGLTLFLLAMVGESKRDAHIDTIDQMIDSFKPRVG